MATEQSTTRPVRGIDGEHVDPAVRPQDDLFRHVNGRWLATARIPDDKAVHGAFNMLQDLSEERLRAIAEEAAAGSGMGGDLGRVGDLYAAFLDEEAVEARGTAPLVADLAAIADVGTTGELVLLLGRLQRTGVTGPFGFWVDGDRTDPDAYTVYITQAGLGLPDESYYREEQYAPVREGYRTHVARMLELAGAVPEGGGADAAGTVLDLETRLAAAHWDRVSCRDATRTYNPVDAAGLAALLPGWDVPAWAAASGAPDGAFDRVVVRQPSYLTALSGLLQELPVAAWRTWLAWHVVHGAAPYLSSALVEENFDFYGRTLTGAPQLRERWKRGVALVESALGEALGRLYVERHFPPASRERMVELVGNLVEAYRRSITGLDWMGTTTRGRALEKLDRFVAKIGYPDSWRDYSAVVTDRGDLVGSIRSAVAAEFDRELAKLGTPVDRSEWFMTPQTVNAYYNPGMNEIVFPAAILQPPFFDPDADDAVNYGAIGAVIGHEIGHGFDDQGSRYDGDGRLRDWWEESDRAEFEERTRALVAQYDALEPAQLPGQHVNGALTVGENIGDLGGLSIAHAAYRIALDGAPAPELGGLGGDERFFRSWAQAWRTAVRDAEAQRRLAVDPHSPPEFRCNAVVRNIDAFHEAFGTAPGDRLWMEPGERVRIW